MRIPFKRVSMYDAFTICLALLTLTAVLSFATNGWALVQIGLGRMAVGPSYLGLLVVRFCLSGLSILMLAAMQLWLRREIFRPLQEFSNAQLHLLSTAVESANDAVVILQGTHGPPIRSRIVYVNAAFERQTGYKREELLGRSPDFLIPPGTSSLAEDLTPALREGRPVLVTTRLLRKDGGGFFEELNVVPLLETGYWMAIGRDLTERLRSEQDLAATNQALETERAFVRNLVDHVPVGIAALDDQLVYRWVNDTYAGIKGHPREWYVGRTLFGVWPETRLELEEPVSRVLSSGRPGTYRSFRDPTQPGRYWDMTGIPLYGKDRIIETLLVLTQDVTDRVTMAQLQQARIRKLQELDALKDSLLSNLSHELKTPISLIVGYSELLEDKYPDEPLLAGILDGNRRLVAHLNNMLDYSALISGSLPLYVSEVCVSELVENALRVEEHGCGAKSLRLEHTIAPDVSCLPGDARRLHQILVELLSNACKATPAGGAVGVEAAREGQEVRLTVWDGGPGLSPEEAHQVWEPFHRAPGSEADQGGLGLGLALVKQLTLLHGGRIELECAAGRGCRVHVYLPLAGPPPGAAP